MKCDVVHAHNYHSFPLFFAALGVTNETFVVTTHYHGSSASTMRDYLLSVYRPLGRWAIHRADCTIAVSEWEREQLRADFDVDASVVPNGLDLERFADAEPAHRDRPYLLCVGRLEEYKGVQHAIRSIAYLEKYDLLIAGKGPFRDRLEAISQEEGVADRVDFLGYVTDDHLPDLYAGAAAHLTLSAFEAYGMTVAEALATGTPCVVRSVGALQDWVDCEGVVGVEDMAPEAVARAVEDCIGRSVTTSVPSWEEVTDTLESTYVAEFA